MYTRIADSIDSEQGEAMASLLRACVHCGFCNASCPTYQVLGDELDGPRGRIYLIKQVLEGQAASRLTQTHLDRCLTCRACETACPSGMQYGRLLDAGRKMVDQGVKRPLWEIVARYALVRMLPYRARFSRLLTVARAVRRLLPRALRRKIPDPLRPAAWLESQHSRKMGIFAGCVQPALAPSIDAAAARVFDRLGITLVTVEAGGCCGAMPHHLSEHGKALEMARRNIDAWEPYAEQGIETIVSTASGCGLMLKDYGRLLQGDSVYAEKAARFSASVKDIAEILAVEDLSGFRADGRRIAFQTPCTLQHGQKINGLPETILARVGYRLTTVENPHLCCGSAGTYSLLQPKLSARFLGDKLEALQAERPDTIATANIGCQVHLQSAARLDVVHWIELLH